MIDILKRNYLFLLMITICQCSCAKDLTLITKCNDLASNPLDKISKGQGVSLDKIDADLAIPACENALKVDEENPRIQYQYARSLQAKGHHDEAMVYYLMAANQGYSAAYNNIGLMYFYGTGVEKDTNKAKEFYLNSSRLGSSNADVNLVILYQANLPTIKDETLRAENLKAQFKWAEAAASKGNMIGEYFSGAYLYKGIGTEKNMDRALALFTLSAKQGYAPAQSQLARMYLGGIGGAEKDTARAFNWAKSSAQKEDAIGQNLMGYLYQNGIGVEANSDLAIQWFNMAGDQNNVSALLSLGQIYKHGAITEKNLELSYKYYLKAAKLGYSDAQYFLALAYRGGEGVAKNQKEATDWFKKAANQEYRSAYDHLGYRAQKGIGGSINLELAAEYYAKSAALNGGYGQFSLGLLYESGTGVKKSLDKAKELFKKSHNNGYEKALAALARVDKSIKNRDDKKSLTPVNLDALNEHYEVTKDGAIYQFKGGNSNLNVKVVRPSDYAYKAGYRVGDTIGRAKYNTSTQQISVWGLRKISKSNAAQFQHCGSMYENKISSVVRPLKHPDGTHSTQVWLEKGATSNRRCLIYMDYPSTCKSRCVEYAPPNNSPTSTFVTTNRASAFKISEFNRKSYKGVSYEEVVARIEKLKPKSGNDHSVSQDSYFLSGGSCGLISCYQQDILDLNMAEAFN